jgi:Protein of unknown function (DUF4244)
MTVQLSRTAGRHALRAHAKADPAPTLLTTSELPMLWLLLRGTLVWLGSVLRDLVRRRLWPTLRSVGRVDSGMSTAEYAIGTIAAAAFAAVLYTVVTGDSVVSGLSALVKRALSVTF